jgi:hypothetical protein
MKELLASPATLRVALYMLLPLVATVPGVTVDPVTDLITIDPHTVWPWLVGGFLAGGGIYAIWGKK